MHWQWGNHVFGPNGANAFLSESINVPGLTVPYSNIKLHLLHGDNFSIE